MSGRGFKVKSEREASFLPPGTIKFQLKPREEQQGTEGRLSVGARALNFAQYRAKGP